MTAYEKCAACATPLVWATVSGRSVLMCPKVTCTRKAVTA